MTRLDDSRGRLYASYVTTHLRGARGRRSFPVLARVPTDRHSRVLDVGCGSGELIAQLRRMGYAEVAGIDRSAEQVALAHRLGRPEVVHGDVHAYLAANKGRYDVITATDVLEHFDRDEVLELLDAIFGALPPGGRLIAQVPNATSPFFGNYAFGDFTHRSVFTARSVNQICRAVGFAEVTVYPVAPFAHGLVSWLRSIIWTVIAGALKLALASETGQLRGHLVTQNLFFAAVKAPTSGSGR
jgi:2-polyprenyl-3-methyl-5-hydroxy-6-metoxy-1,4-benzoquinol methylase